MSAQRDTDQDLQLSPSRPEARLVDLRFRALLGAAEWERLPADVRRRFSKRLSGSAAATYVGRITELRMNRAGRILSQALRLIGAPLPVCLDTDVASVVTVTEDGATGGQVWTRLYAKRGGFPQVIHSAKRFAGPTGLEEYVGYGVAMPLRLSVEDGALTFRSAGYTLRLGRFRVALPGWLSPGALTVTHRETGAGAFEFALSLRHPLFGELLRQSGRYRDQRG
ncbi:hypothetical protein JOD31_003405 [Methylopila capsulata]|uniref:DUF4166 domain-containing protein n=1 Tax=Methylopila capsulata TaxID=61654 RepID=A0A9W6IW05_9HYPH|nr:DUF4166 domain-containing protein [Methylopila capsulata]MBM7853154.1 hypothetical protein [Methylopila capsulata]GLK57632.1 hypothetical protein GCM10008170_36520 [Methylopila capsulata]